MLARLVCPECRGEIVRHSEGWCCVPCEKKYHYRDGVLCFLNAECDDGDIHKAVQEQAWEASARLRERIRTSRWLAALNRSRIKYSLSGRRDRVFYDHMRGGDANRLILDLGCGGGRHYFCEFGRVVGVDAILTLLQISRKIYDEVYQANICALPFADESFDCVVSSDVLGHIPIQAKDQVFAEMFRVLKPGGYAIHVVETDATNLWFRFAHRYPDLFNEYFIERPGHIGLERPSQLRKRFLKPLLSGCCRLRRNDR